MRFQNNKFDTNIDSCFLYGAGGLGKEIASLIFHLSEQYRVIGFIDDDTSKTTYYDIPVYHSLSAVSANQYVIPAVGNPIFKQDIVERIGKNILKHPICHPMVIINDKVNIGHSTIITEGVRLTTDIAIGDFVLLNLNTTIGHDTIIEDFCSIMPGVNISGNVHIGKATLVGSGAVILPGIKIGKYCTIGAGAVVTKDIPDNAVAVGVPARVVEGRK